MGSVTRKGAARSRTNQLDFAHARPVLEVPNRCHTQPQRKAERSGLFESLAQMRLNEFIGNRCEVSPAFPVANGD